MKLENTGRGMPVVRFRDIYDQECSIQESSLSGPRALWIGCDKNIDGNVNNRAHITQDQARELLPYLIRFASFGTIAPGAGTEAVESEAQA